MQGFGCGALGNLSSGNAWQAVVDGGGEAAAAMRLHTAHADRHGFPPISNGTALGGLQLVHDVPSSKQRVLTALGDAPCVKRCQF